MTALDQLVDWDLAARTAARVAGPGPKVPRGQAREAVEALRAAARAATPHVAEVTGLAAAPGAGVLVVDRVGWATVNVQSFRALLGPALEQVLAGRDQRTHPAVAAVGSRVTGAELGALLGFLGARVLGQFDPFGADPGRLLLVAPNIVHVERELGVDPADFRLWVCLHEETHRVQFAGTGWLAGHLQQEISGLVGDLMAGPAQLAERLLALARNARQALPATGPSTGVPPVDALQTPAQRERIARLTAVMSLLEGHADVVMDEVGPAVVPTVATIRARFDQRRSGTGSGTRSGTAGRGGVEHLLRRLLGLDAKLRQYADGARFVRGVRDRVGQAGFDAVWAGPGNLPLPAEIVDPALWVRRVHG